MDESIQLARAWVAEARNIAVLTGAGVSADSGVPTFRGPGGLWRNHKPEKLATREAFEADPKLVWEWYDYRRGVLSLAEPNAGHSALADWERACTGSGRGFQLITQNVDGLHDAAGSTGVLKLHGDIWTLRCIQCGVSVEDRRSPLPQLPPQCVCGGIQRPGVVWFGESLPEAAWNAAMHAARNCDVLLVAGTSAVVYPAAGLIDLAGRRAKVIEVNLEATHYSQSVDISLRGKTSELLPKLIG